MAKWNDEMLALKVKCIDNARLMNYICDQRLMYMARPHISVFFEQKRFYNCPDCKLPMDRTNRHGWFWKCSKCLNEHPLYKLEKHEIKEQAKEEGWGTKFLKRIREAV